MSIILWLNSKYNIAPQKYNLISLVNIFGHNKICRKWLCICCTGNKSEWMRKITSASGLSYFTPNYSCNYKHQQRTRNIRQYQNIWSYYSVIFISKYQYRHLKIQKLSLPLFNIGTSLVQKGSYQLRELVVISSWILFINIE